MQVELLSKIKCVVKVKIFFSNQCKKKKKKKKEKKKKLMASSNEGHS